MASSCSDPPGDCVGGKENCTDVASPLIPAVEENLEKVALGETVKKLASAIGDILLG